MCGIAGLASSCLSPEAVEAALNNMARLLAHRGPDGRQTLVRRISGKTVGLGFVRLAILDLPTGMQPMVCPLDDTRIVCNGQIYNYLELKSLVADQPFASQGDVEVALHLYRRLGVRFLHQLNGMYAGAIVDPAEDRLLLFRDRFGVKPLYYYVGDSQFAFASEIKPLLSLPGVTGSINARQLAMFFKYRYAPGNETLFEGIHRLPPGAYLDYRISSGAFTIVRYWDYHLDGAFADMDADGAAERFYDLFTDAVRLRLRADVEVGAFISGGIDSSAVAALAARHQPGLRLFSIGFENKAYDELPKVAAFLSAHPDTFAQSRIETTLCRKSDLERLPGIAKAMEEPVSLGTLLPTDMVCEMAARRVKVVLTGEGADEIFGGYRKFMIEAAAAQYDLLSAAKRRALLEVLPELKGYVKAREGAPAARYIQAEALFSDETIKALTGHAFPGYGFPEDALPWLSGREAPLNAMIAFETRFRLPDYVVMRLDRLSMRHSLEARTPFLDYRLAEFAATLKVDLKINLETAREKFICGHAFKRHGLVDGPTAARRKQPFTIPLAQWLSEPDTLPECLQEILLGDAVARQGILDPSCARALTRRVTAEGVGPETLVSAADQVLAVIMFTLWYQAFFE